GAAALLGRAPSRVPITPLLMASTATTTSTPLDRDEARGLFGQTMGLVALTAGCFALGAYVGRNAPGGWAILFYILSFGVLWGMNAATKRSEQMGVGLLFAFGLLLGLAVAPTIAYYVGADPQA